MVNPQTARLYFCPHSTRGTPIRRPFLVIDPCFFSNCVCMCSILLFDVPGWPHPWFTHEVPVESVIILLAPGKSSYIKFIFIHIYIYVYVIQECFIYCINLQLVYVVLRSRNKISLYNESNYANAYVYTTTCPYFFKLS